jgi:small subunit ribosomal protein S16
VAVRIRLKKLGRKHRPFFRICAMDVKAPRDGRVIEELGHYDPMVPDADARVVLERERVDYWIGVGALPTRKVAVLLRKYGTSGSHLAQNAEALKKLKSDRQRRGPPEGFKPAVIKAKPKPEAAPEGEAPAAEPGVEAPAEG